VAAHLGDNRRTLASKPKAAMMLLPTGPWMAGLDQGVDGPRRCPLADTGFVCQCYKEE
jgi:hypothetical protein